MGSYDMKSTLHNKIYIIGSVGSGKTTMAKELSKQLYKWSRGFEKSKDDILEILEGYKEKVIILEDNKDISLINR